MNLDLDIIKALAVAAEEIKSVAGPWGCTVKMQILCKLESVEVDTSADGYDQYLAGSISQVIRPVHYIELIVCQSERAELSIGKAPKIPIIFMRPIESEIKFHAETVFNKLKTPPGGWPWDDKI